MDLEFQVKNQQLIRKDENVLVSKSRNYVCCHFEFCTEDWYDLEKFVIFKNEDKESFSMSLGTENNVSVQVPNQALTGDYFKVSVHGGDLITSSERTVVLLPAGYTTNISPIDNEKGKDVFLQIFEEMESKIDRITYDDGVMNAYSENTLLFSFDLLKEITDDFASKEHTHITKDITDFENTVDFDLNNLIVNLTDNIRMI